MCFQVKKWEEVYVNNWITSKLGDVCEVVRGGSPRPIIDFVTDSPDGVNWLKIGDVSEHDKYFKHSTERIKQAGTAKSREVKKGDLILSNSMSFGRAFITLIDGYIHDGWLRLRNNEDILDREYLYYFLSSEFAQNQFKAVATGSVVNNLKLDTVKAVNIDIPPINEQRAIVSILTALDNKIDNNRKINNHLELMAQAIFNEMFGKCDPNAKLVDAVITANTGGDAIRIAPIVDFNTGIRCIRVGDLSNNRDFNSWGFCEIKSSDYTKLQLKQGDIVVSRTASLGLNTFIYEDLQAVYNNGLIRLRPNRDKVYPLFLFLLLRQKEYFDFINRITGETSVRPNMKIEYLLSYPITLPSLIEQEKLLEVVNPILLKINRNIDESYNLVELRNNLLPRLMSGELTVLELETAK
jgi:type I restriction enzyme S subunit